jgi:hypothetical protein
MSARFVGTLVAGAAAAVVALTGMPAASAAVDTTPPVLHGVTLSPAALVPGGTLTATVDATDDVAVTRVRVDVIEEASGHYRTLDAPGVGLTASAPVTSSWANGTYGIRFVVVWDAAGNSSTYYPDGTYRTIPASATTTHGLDLKTQQAKVSGASDLSPPVLSALTMTAAATRAEDPTTVAFAVSDVQSTVQLLSLTWKNDDSGQVVAAGTVTKPAAAGTIAARLPTAGRWHLESVFVSDTLGNSAIYDAAGQVSGSGMGGTHTLDLAAVHIALAPGPQGVTVVPRPGRLTVVRPGAASDASVLSGYRITVQPAGVVREVSVAALSSGLLELAGLPNGVTQTVTFTAHSTWGDSPVATKSSRPVLSGNVTGIADVTGDGRVDVVAQRQFGLGQDPAVLSYPGTGAGRLRAATTFLPTNQGGCEQLAAGDLYILGAGEPLCQHDDLVALNRGGGGTILGSRGWSGMRWVDGGYSLNADGYPDVIAMNPAGDLLLYPQTSRGSLAAPTRIGAGWGSMISVVSAGDLTGDRRNDIAAVDSSGRLWVYPGNGAGGVTARRQIGSGWQSMGALLPLRDLSGDGKADLGGITMGGELRLYRGTGTGGVGTGVTIGTGWQGFL